MSDHNKNSRNEKRYSLYPLTPEEAILRLTPNTAEEEPKETGKKKKHKAKRKKKQ